MSVISPLNETISPSLIGTLPEKTEAHHPATEVALALLSSLALGKGKDLGKATIEWIKHSPLFLKSFFSDAARNQYLIVSELKDSFKIYFGREGVKITPEISKILEELAPSLQENLKKEFAKPIGERSVSNLPQKEQLLLVMLILGQPKGLQDRITDALKSELNFEVGSEKYTQLFTALREILPNFAEILTDMF